MGPPAPPQARACARAREGQKLERKPPGPRGGEEEAADRLASPFPTSRPSGRSLPSAVLGRTEPPTAAKLEELEGRMRAGGPQGALAGGGGGHCAGRALSRSSVGPGSQRGGRAPPLDTV